MKRVGGRYRKLSQVDRNLLTAVSVCRCHRFTWCFPLLCTNVIRHKADELVCFPPNTTTSQQKCNSRRIFPQSCWSFPTFLIWWQVHFASLCVLPLSVGVWHTNTITAITTHTILQQRNPKKISIQKPKEKPAKNTHDFGFGKPNKNWVLSSEFIELHKELNAITHRWAEITSNKKRNKISKSISQLQF